MKSEKTAVFLNKIRIDWRSRFLAHRNFKMAAMTSFHAGKCCRLVYARIASTLCLCSSVHQFLI